MSTKLLKSKPFQRILAGKFALPKEQSCGWFFEDADDRGDAFRGAVRALCALGAAAVALLSEAVEHQEITRKNVSKLVESLEGQGLIIVHDGDAFLELPARLRPTLLGEDVLLALDDLFDALEPAAPVVIAVQETTALSPSI